MPRNELETVMHAVADGDAPKVASLCEYPIERPYPLRNIADSGAMVKYFPILADEGLRNAMRKGHINEWSNGGWRGWLFGDTALLSYEDGIYAVGYVSDSEHALRNILSHQEIESLAPELRGEWQPVTCLLDTMDGAIFRIDRDHASDSSISPWAIPSQASDGKLVVYRLAYYSPESSLSHAPSATLHGSVREEGSMGTPVFTFVDAKGDSCIYIGNDSDGEPNISFRSKSGASRELYAVPVYWRDYISKKR